MRLAPQFKLAPDPGLVARPGCDSFLLKDEGGARDKGKAKENSGKEPLRGSMAPKNTKGASHLQALTFIDSPRVERLVRGQKQLPENQIIELSEEFSNGKSNESSTSTIESFGNRSTNTAHSLYEALQTERSMKATNEIIAKEKRLKDESEKRTMYGSKRRRIEREQRDTERHDTNARYQQIEAKYDQRRDADELWNNIWGRWDQSMHRNSLIKNSANMIVEDGMINSLSSNPQEGQVVSQDSHTSIQSQDGQMEAKFSFYHFESQDAFILKEPVEEDKEVIASEGEDQDASRSRMDPHLLLCDDDSTMMMEKESEERQEESAFSSQRQRQVDAICKEDDNNEASEMRQVGYTIFRKSNVAKYFSPARDGYRLQRDPPKRRDVSEWAIELEMEGHLYAYDDEFERIPHWDDDSIGHIYHVIV